MGCKPVQAPWGLRLRVCNRSGSWQWGGMGSLAALGSWTWVSIVPGFLLWCSWYTNFDVLATSLCNNFFILLLYISLWPCWAVTWFRCGHNVSIWNRMRPRLSTMFYHLMGGFITIASVNMDVSSHFISCLALSCLMLLCCLISVQHTLSFADVGKGNNPILSLGEKTTRKQLVLISINHLQRFKKSDRVCNHDCWNLRGHCATSERHKHQPQQRLIPPPTHTHSHTLTLTHA